ncbi:acetylserotonin O-methyltransferase [Methylobacterium sp. J-090]|uniref:acetylserotonin O-methyltransferase n=1 Tax=Methylobacterium sp. J-090 TaxID=2836666 RepID=UPI001FB9B605|nr:acetylserotonin O-methyltransferase [Methylobacterium sp. J-090]MCJ2081592.1 acetylserotonin O-methyltransferase [Methylobacterium sp. J-090]
MAGSDTPRGDGAHRKDSWRARWRAFRTRTIARPGFQRWAAGFPLTRRIARANTKALFDLCAGFVYSQTLFACVRLDLFRLLADGPLAPDALAARVGLAPDRAERLLKAATALDLLARLPDGRFALADLGAALIGNPSVAAMIEHHALLYADLADPVALLRGEAGPTNLSGYWAYAEAARGDPASAAPVAAYGELMGASQALIAGDILDAYPLRDHHRILDVGGGEGAFLKAAARHAPGLDLMLFDLPAVAARAATRFAEADLSARARTFGGAFPDDPLPGGADVVTLVRVVHDHDDAKVRALLRAAHAALPAGGTLLIAEPMAGTPGAEAMADAYFGFYLLAMGTGRCRTAAELTDLLTEAGFGAIREIPTRRPLLTRLLVSTRLDNR